jgi:Terminase large subunit, T4likevirus-type, N-terminal
MAGKLAQDLALALDPTRIFTAAGLAPDLWQREFLRARPQRALLCCCRQAGKSLTVAAAGLHEALYRPGSLVLMLAPSQRQSAELLRKTRSLLNALAPTVGSETESTLALELTNGSRIVSLPGKEATVRGYSDVALLAIDEAARVEEDLYVAVRPMLAVSGGRLIALSTPHGQRGWFYEAWQSSEAWQRVRVTAPECPRISADFLAQERRVMSPAAFASEYECQFTDAVDAVFAHDDVMAALDPTLNPLYQEEW